MIADHHRLLLIRQINTHDRVISRHQPAQLGQPGVAALVTTRQTTTLGHDVLLAVIGTRTRQRHQEGVFIFFIDTQRHSSSTTHARGKGVRGGLIPLRRVAVLELTHRFLTRADHDIVGRSFSIGGHQTQVREYSCADDGLVVNTRCGG
jgi:hypothetical protein